NLVFLFLIQHRNVLMTSGNSNDGSEMVKSREVVVVGTRPSRAKALEVLCRSFAAPADYEAFFSRTSCGRLRDTTTSRVTTHSLTPLSEGISYITSSITSSRIARRPRARDVRRLLPLPRHSHATHRL